MSSWDREKMEARTREFWEFCNSENSAKKPPVNFKLVDCHARRRARNDKSKAQKRFENFLSYGNLEFYKKRGGALNIAKIARVAGISPAVVRRELAKRDLI